MPETAQQYIARILSNSAGQDGLAVLGGTADRLKALLESTPVATWRERPAPGRWSAAEVLAHLADAEVVAGWRVRSILEETIAHLIQLYAGHDINHVKQIEALVT